MFSLLRRRPRLPADRRPPLERDERVLAWAAVGDGSGDASAGTAARADAAAGAVVATNLGLWLPGEPGRLGWHEVHKAVWAGRELTVTPAEVVEERAGYTVVADRPPRAFLLLAPGDVPHQVRARVTGSVAYTAYHRLPGGGGARVVARRVAGADGLSWAVRFDPGGAADPAAAAAVDELVAGARAAVTDPTL